MGATFAALFGFAPPHHINIEGRRMSFFPAKDPAQGDALACDAIEHVVVPRTSDVGGLAVRRALPSARRRMVGPFIFLDHMGPAEFRSGQGLDVRPHPHIGLATVTYLFAGEIMHRDSIGSVVPIRPGAINWMSAGRGIAHSERTAEAHRVAGEPLHGLQCWVALPQDAEESAPAFAHYEADLLPVDHVEGKTIRVVAGQLYGRTSPVKTAWETIFADITLEAGAKLPVDPDAEERALYIVSGEIDILGDRFGAGHLLVLRHGDRITVSALAPTRLILLGGATMDGPRHIWWNFVSSRKDRIEEAKAEWKAGRFGAVPGETEFIPLPEE
jgi:redox-sensitive bicupin YhaK (pirin superfamily)